MFFDPLYFVFALPPLLLGLYARWRVKRTFNEQSQVRVQRGLTGAQIARELLDAEGLHDVTIEAVDGFLSDHYDPRKKVLRLSSDVYDSPTVAAAGVAAHEMGHALQDAQQYTPLTLRSAMVPSVQFGSWLGPLIFIAGLFVNFPSLAWLGLILFGATVVFAVVTLPVELDASRRAKALLTKRGLLYKSEMEGVSSVLNAAALTYVAAALQAVATLAYYAFILMGDE